MGQQSGLESMMVNHKQTKGIKELSAKVEALENA